MRLYLTKHNSNPCFSKIFLLLNNKNLLLVPYCIVHKYYGKKNHIGKIHNSRIYHSKKNSQKRKHYKRGHENSISSV